MTKSWKENEGFFRSLVIGDQIELSYPNDSYRSRGIDTKHWTGGTIKGEITNIQIDRTKPTIDRENDKEFDVVYTIDDDVRIAIDWSTDRLSVYEEDHIETAKPKFDEITIEKLE